MEEVEMKSKYKKISKRKQSYCQTFEYIPFFAS